MIELGWIRDARSVGGGNYCPRCAHLLRIARLAEHCAWCEAPMVEERRAEIEGWGYYADALGMLHPCCPGCLADRFGITAQVRPRRIT